jgi:outer membrane protein assembly factor BamB
MKFNKEFNLMSIITILVLTLLSCNKDSGYIEYTPPPWKQNRANFTPEILWEVPVAPDTMDCITFAPIVTENYVVFGNQFCRPGGNDVIRTYNKQTGEFLWEWGEGTGIGGVSSWRSHYINEDNLLLSMGRNILSLDIESGSVNWNYEAPKSYSPRIELIGSYLYWSHGERVNDSLKYLVRTPTDRVEFDTIFTSQAPLGYRYNYEPPVAATDASGRDLLLLPARFGIGSAPANYEVEITALDATTFEPVWKIDTLPYDWNSSVTAPVVREQTLIFPGEENLYGIDVSTGDILWHVPIPDGTLTTDLIEHDGYAYFVGNLGTLYKVDWRTGDLVYAKEGYGGNVSNMIVHDDLLYYVSGANGRLYAVHIETGEKIWEEAAPNRDEVSFASFGLGGIAIDHETEILYTADRVAAYALKLPE